MIQSKSGRGALTQHLYSRQVQLDTVKNTTLHLKNQIIKKHEQQKQIADRLQDHT